MGEEEAREMCDVKEFVNGTEDSEGEVQADRSLNFHGG